FRDTYELVKVSPLNWLHIFPYSERPGTPAEKLNFKVPQKEIEERKKLLKDLIEEKRKRFLEKELGKIRKAVLESFDRNKLMWKALSENYITTYLTLDKNSNRDEKLKRALIKVKFLKREDDYLVGNFLKLL
ncbi:MAG: hypothetical protein C0169_03085, partial [Thermodesulfobacterium geofontis]